MQQDNILIVEDDIDTRFILERLLKKNQYNVLTANNGSEALQVLETFEPKVIVADWTMPVMDGVQLCHSIKQSERWKSIYFILLTARSSLKDRVTGLDFGADDFLVKPVENQELFARIRSGIRIYNLQYELRKSEHNKALIELACTIGHQLNNPLSSLLITLKNLELEVKEKGVSQDEDFQLIYKAIGRITNAVEALKNIQNPEVVSYSNEQGMLKIPGLKE